MSYPSDDEKNPIAEFMRLAAQQSAAREKNVEKVELALNSNYQALRMALTVMVDDPTSPVTEMEFAGAMKYYFDFIDTVSSAFPLPPHVKDTVLEHAIKYLQWYLQRGKEMTATCLCERCQAAQAAKAFPPTGE